MQVLEFGFRPWLHCLLKIRLWLLSLETCSSSAGMQNVDQLMNLPFNSVKMEPCYLKVNLLQELLPDLKSRFKVYHIDFVIQRTQNFMQEVQYCKIQLFLLGVQVRFVLICFKVILIKSCVRVPDHLSAKVQITKPNEDTARSCLTFTFVRLHVCESSRKT